MAIQIIRTWDRASIFALLGIESEFNQLSKSSKTLSPEEFEDFVAAHFQAGQRFVEKNVKERDEYEVLELDAVATDYQRQSPQQTLIEVKSGNWGFPDIFKISGWMKYLGIPRGAFIVCKRPRDKPVEFYNDRVKRLNIELMVIDDPQKADKVFANSRFKLRCDKLICDIWRSSYLIERRLLCYLESIRKTNKSMVGPLEALRYYSLVNNAIFFVPISSYILFFGKYSFGTGEASY